MDICTYVVWFGVFSVVGWVAECIYTSAKSGEWENRGFLFGPVCPIYGTGSVAILLLYTALVASAGGQVSDVAPWQVFVASVVGSAVMEYVTSFVLEHFFHARWWDYSEIPFNVKGRICLPFALMFGVAGLVLFYFVAEPVSTFSARVPLLAWEILAMLTVGTMSADLGLTIAALGDLTKKLEAMQADFDAVMEVAVNDMVNGRPPFTVEAEEQVSRIISGLSSFQKHSVRHITTYTSDKREAAAGRLREAMARARKSVKRKK